MTVTKEKIVAEVFERTDLSRREAREAVETLLSLIKRTLADEDCLLLSGFGKFTARTKRARPGRNPQTGETLELRPRRVITFRHSGILVRALNRPVADR